MQRSAYEFGPYRQEPATRTLTRNGVPVEIPPKNFDTLLYLVSNAGRTVGRDEIMRAVWPDTFVEESNLNYNISRIRSVLGDYEPGVPYIQTIPKQGYRFVAHVRCVAAEPSLEPQSEKLGRSRWIRLAVALPVLAATIFVTGTLIRYRVAASGERVGHDSGLVRLTSDSGLTMTPALSPDGRLLAYASDRGGNGNLSLWVQQVGSESAIRLTTGPMDDYSPSFSPDGREIVFRSERDGGGIYAVPALGGQATKVAPFGRRPRYSPDGKWIAYWVGTDASGFNQTNFPAPGSANIYIVRAEGGPARQLRGDFAAAAYPVWAPDSKHILFLGNSDSKVMVEPSKESQPGGQSVDWWVTPIDGGQAKATGANTAFRALGLASVSQIPEAWCTDQPGVLTSLPLADAHNLWRIPVSLENWTVSETPSRVSFGTTMDVQPSMAAGRVAFASLSGSLDIWTLPIDANRAKSSGSLQRLTADAYDHFYPAVSPDGSKIAYSSRRSGSRDIWVRDLTTGKETVVSRPPASAFGAIFSPDGSRLSYRSLEKQTSVTYIASLVDGSQERISECVSQGGWSSDGRALLCVGTAPARVSLFDLQTRRMIPLLTQSSWALWNPRFSPDDRWISFNATKPGQSRIFVAPFGRAGLIPESDWIPVTEGVWDDKPRWSPDGNLLYFMSERDGSRCIWAQRLDVLKHPAGPAFPVFHAHDARRSLLSVQVGALELSLSRDKIIFNMNERSGNIWMTISPRHL